MPVPTTSELKKYCRITGDQDDALIDSFSEVAQRQFKKILAKDNLPDNPSINLALKIQVQSYYENRGFLKPDVDKAVSQKVLNLINSDRDVSAFIPDVSEDSE